VNGFLLGLFVLAGTPLVTPWVLRQVAAHLPVRRFGLLYGVRGLAARLQTAAFATASLAVAGCMLVGITLMVGSFRRTIAVWVDSTVRADVYVTTESWRRARDQAVLGPEVIAALSRIPHVARVDRLRQVTTTAGGAAVNLGGIDMGLPGGERRFVFLEACRARRCAAPARRVPCSWGSPWRAGGDCAWEIA
jgi:putative ABC transport system permease protein